MFTSDKTLLDLRLGQLVQSPNFTLIEAMTAVKVSLLCVRY